MNADLIVMYHSVVPDEAAVDDWLHVPVSRFEAQLRCRSTRFSLRTTAVRRCRRGRRW